MFLRDTEVLIPHYLVTAKHIKVNETSVFLENCSIAKILQKYFATKRSLSNSRIIKTFYSLGIVSSCLLGIVSSYDTK